jgi:hypothetical protein
VSATEDAKRALFRLGHELPGERLRRFATDLLVATRNRPDASPEVLVDEAIGAIENGPATLVAEEPDLRTAPLDPPATSVDDAASAAVSALGHQLIATYRRY